MEAAAKSLVLSIFNMINSKLEPVLPAVLDSPLAAVAQ